MADNLKEKDRDRFNELAQQKRNSIIKEFWLFLRDNKKWWLLPILIILLILGLLVLIGGSALAPFIYPLF
jgi:polyferredoxin